MKINIDRHDIKWDDDVRISIKSQSKKIRILRIIYHISLYYLLYSFNFLSIIASFGIIFRASCSVNTASDVSPKEKNAQDPRKSSFPWISAGGTEPKKF